MANDPLDLSIGPLQVRHVPEPDETYDPAAYDDPKHVTGFIDIGAEVDGVFVILQRRKAPGLVADIERAKAASKSAQPDESPSPSAPSQ